VHRVGVQRRELDLLLVQEDGIRRHRPCGDDMPVGHDDAKLSVDDEAGGQREAGVIHVEGHHGADPYHNDAAGHALERALPASLSAQLHCPRRQPGKRHSARNRSLLLLVH
jgi:hypothetical protein